MNLVVQPITYWVPIKRQVVEVGGVSRFFMTSRGLPTSPTMGNSFSDKLRTKWAPVVPPAQGTQVGSCLAFQWPSICTWIIKLVRIVKMLWSSCEKQWVESSQVKYLSGSWGVCHHGDIPTFSIGSQTGHIWIREKRLWGYSIFLQLYFSKITIYKSAHIRSAQFEEF